MRNEDPPGKKNIDYEINEMIMNPELYEVKKPLEESYSPNTKIIFTPESNRHEENSNSPSSFH